MSKKNPEMMKFRDQVRIDGWAWTVKWTILDWWYCTALTPWYGLRKWVGLPMVERYTGGRCCLHLSHHGPIFCNKMARRLGESSSDLVQEIILAAFDPDFDLEKFKRGMPDDE